MKSVYDIIRKPIISEKSMAGMQDKTYAFKVAVDANKVEIKKQLKKSSAYRLRRLLQ